MNAVSGAIAIFEKANEFCGDIFEVKIATLQPVNAISIGRYSIKPDLVLADAKDPDLIILPSMGSKESPEKILEQNQFLLEYILNAYQSGSTQIASLCTGAYFLAATGLLDGKEASSHWAAIGDLKKRFPGPVWQGEYIITDQEGIYTSGGAYSSLNLILYLVEKFSGKETAVRVSKIFEIDYNRKSQSPFMIFNNQRTHGDEKILAVQQYMEQHFQENLSVDFLAERFGMSRRNLIRRFKIATGNTPKTYMQRLRIEEAKRIFESTGRNVSETMLEVGYTDLNTFRSLFMRHTGILPSQYRQKFGI